ncbi:MAG: MarR family transcriptional regulator [Proteobacteria bacterium]|nr:MarR family transcriptional regulator [Pseudomonadota bacterium]MBU1387395.1 MarR family transcriptional regulator [Pseudomonadota bacterium]MBU1541680.1 MarR family transcriptional regulator [Pseudomonadota bacterium]MBU2431267.1 MarR family transcriptional regulator [Pseudomonadota bacterium]MBU2482016.1 MarR family transcriptional regulator [Pseudomonadota bacterium]
MADKNKIYHSGLPIQEKAAFLIICSAQELLNKLGNITKEFGISLTQLQILHILDEIPQGKTTVNTIRNLLVDDSPNVSRSINKLVDKQLAQKERSTEDQRVVFVSITDAGRSVHHQCDRRIVGNTIHLSPNASQQLADLLISL